MSKKTKAIIAMVMIFALLGVLLYVSRPRELDKINKQIQEKREYMEYAHDKYEEHRGIADHWFGEFEDTSSDIFYLRKEADAILDGTACPKCDFTGDVVLTEIPEELTGNMSIIIEESIVEEKETHNAPGSTFPGAWSDLSLDGKFIERSQGMKNAQYLIGGKSRESIDCSGLLSLFLHEEGLITDKAMMWHWDSNEFARNVPRKNLNLLEEGDLLFFDNLGKGPDHIAFVVGGVGNEDGGNITIIDASIHGVNERTIEYTVQPRNGDVIGVYEGIQGGRYRLQGLEDGLDVVAEMGRKGWNVNFESRATSLTTFHNNDRKKLPNIFGNTKEKRYNSFVSFYGIDPNIFVQVREQTGTPEELLACIAWADSGLGTELKSENNIGNVGNNDRGDVQSFDGIYQGALAIGNTLNNSYLGTNYMLGELSGNGRVNLGLPGCETPGEYCYATSVGPQGFWNTNVLNCLSIIEGERIDEDYIFRS